MGQTIEDRARLQDMRERLTDSNETGRAVRGHVSGALLAFGVSWLPAVVGIAIPDNQLVANSKAGQNREQPDRISLVLDTWLGIDIAARSMAALLLATKP